MKRLFQFLFLSLFIISSCGEDDSPDIIETNDDPAAFSVTIIDVSISSARLEWTVASDPDGDVVVYDVVLGGILLASDLSGTSFDLTELDPDTAYQGHVIASDGEGGEAIATFSFTTIAEEESPATNEPPGDFTVTVGNLLSTSANLEWTTAEDPDGDEVIYNVTLGSTELASGLSDTNLDLTDLSPETTYTGQVTASDGNGGESTADFSFSTLLETPAANQDPEDFMISVSNISQTSAKLVWDAAVDPDGDAVTYEVLLAGIPVATGLTDTSFDLTELDSGTAYEGTVVASDGNGGENSVFFSFATLEQVIMTPTISQDFFNDAFVSIETVMAQLEDGTMAECYKITFTGDGVDAAVGPYCPETSDDIGGLAVYDGETNPGLRNISGSLLADMEADGWDIIDENGNVNITDLSGPTAMNASTCIEANYDPSLTFIYLIPVDPKIASSNNTIDEIENVGVSVDGTPLTGAPPSAVNGPSGIPGGGNGTKISFPSLDPCGGHPDPSGYYHAHFIPQVMDQVLAANGISEVSCTLFEQTTSVALAGFAKDGYPVYAYANMPSDLDECQGRTAATPEYPNGIYHYVASTTDAPNMPPCIKGVAASVSFEVQ